MTNYSDVLRRLDAYRNHKNLSKNEMAKILGVYSNNYHQIEIGKRMLSMNSLKNFVKNGGDLYFLLSGQEKEVGPIEEIFSKCESEAHKKEILYLLIVNIEYASWLDGNSSGGVLQKLRKAIRLFDKDLAEYSFWKRIRKIEFLNQMQMADLLEVETKRYRRIELEQIQPDLGILCALEKKLNYSSQLFFDKKQFFYDELNYYWNRLSEDSKKYVMSTIIDSIKRFYLK